MDESEGRLLASQINSCRVVRISAEQQLSQFSDSVFVRDGQLIERAGGAESGICDLNSVRSLSGLHNQQNACAAYAACRHLGLSAPEIAAGLKRFPGLPHRSQIIGEFGGILWGERFQGDQCRERGKSPRSLPEHPLDCRRACQGRWHRIAVGPVRAMS